MQKRIVRSIIMTAALLAGCTLAGATTVEYDYSGTCTHGCTGTMSVVVILSDYYPADPLTPSEFVSLSYQSSDTTFSFTSLNSNDIGGSVLNSLPSTSGDAYELFIPSSYPMDVFSTNGSGGWNLQTNFYTKDPFSIDSGNSGLWTLSTGTSATPEPTGLLLASTGGALLVFLRKLKRQKA